MNIPTIRINHNKAWFDWCVLYAPFIITGILFLCCLVMELTHTVFPENTRATIYSTVGDAFYYYSIVLTFLYGCKYGLKWITALLCAFAAFHFVFSGMNGVWRNIEMSLFGGGSYAAFRGAIFLLPMSALLAGLFKKKILLMCDYLTPFFFYLHGSVTIACWVMGCCAGKPLEWGIYNPRFEQTAFPMQPLIILLSVGVAFWGVMYAKKHAYKANGKVFAYSLIAYGLGRIALEFMSANVRVVGALSFNSLCSLAMIAVGALLSYFIYKKFSVEENNETENI